MSIERIDNNNDNPKAKDQPKKKAAALNSTAFYVHNRNKWNEKKREPIRWEKKKLLIGKIDRRCNVMKTYKNPMLEMMWSHTQKMKGKKERGREISHETALPMRQTQN